VDVLKKKKKTESETRVLAFGRGRKRYPINGGKVVVYQVGESVLYLNRAERRTPVVEGSDPKKKNKH